MTADNQPWWEGLPGTPATDWQGRPYDPANGPAAHPNSRFTVSARQCPTWSAQAEDAAGRADQRHRVRRPAPVAAAAGDGGPRLDPRRADGRGHGLGNHRRRHRRGRRAAPRPDGDEAVLRLPLRRLLRALAVVRPAGRQAAGDLPRQLVPQGRRRPLPVARLRRQPARAGMDDRARRGYARAASRRRSAYCPTPANCGWTAWISTAARSPNCLRSTMPAGRSSWPRSASTCTSSRPRVPAACSDEQQRVAAALAEMPAMPRKRATPRPERAPGRARAGSGRRRSNLFAPAAHPSWQDDRRLPRHRNADDACATAHRLPTRTMSAPPPMATARRSSGSTDGMWNASTVRCCAWPATTTHAPRT